MAASASITAKKAFDRCIRTTSPWHISFVVWEQRVGEPDRADQERGESPGPPDAECGHDEHRETGSHAEGRDGDFLQREGATRFANPPSENGYQTNQGTECRTWDR
jgi:hypothetical protein